MKLLAIAGIADGPPGNRLWRTPVPMVAASIVLSVALGAIVATSPALAWHLVGLAAVLSAVLLLQAASKVSLAAVVFLLLLGMLVALGRVFSHLQFGPVYVTEVAILVLSVLIAAKLFGQTLMRQRIWARVPFAALFAIYFALGLIAFLRGVTGNSDIYYVARDATLVVYSLVAVLAMLIFPRLSDVRTAYRVLYWAAIPATIYTAVNFVTEGALGSIAVAQGLYLSFFFIPVLARWSVGQLVKRWEWWILVLQTVLLVAMTARTSWIAALLAVTVLAATSEGRRWRRVATPIALAMAVGVLVVVWVMPSLNPSNPVASAVSGLTKAASGTLNPSIEAGSDAANSLWRLHFWGHDLRQAAAHPLTGVGFGPASNFCFQNECDDTRLTRDVKQYTGPHNSYINVAFRLGFVGLAALALLIIAGVRVAARGMSRAVREHRHDDAITIRIALASFAFVATTCFFAIGLETPYIGLFFWTTLGFLMVSGRSV